MEESPAMGRKQFSKVMWDNKNYKSSDTLKISFHLKAETSELSNFDFIFQVENSFCLFFGHTFLEGFEAPLQAQTSLNDFFFFFYPRMIT